MSDQEKTKEQLIEELVAMRQQVAEPGAEKKRKAPIDEIYINELRKHKTAVQIFLVNGTCLSGKIEAFSPYAVILRSQGRQQLVQKGAIVSIRPEKPGTYDVFKVRR